MKIVVCYKNVPNADGIQVNRDLTLDMSGAAWEIGQYDMNAIEAAVSLASAAGDSQVLALTAAGDVVDNTKQRKAVLSRGPEKMIGVKDSRLESADAYSVAQTLAAAINRLGDVDLVVFGEGSGDSYAQQTGILTGALLGWNTVNAVKALSLSDAGLKLTRAGADADEELEVSLPAALTVTSDINRPRIPTLKDIMAAGKKPVEVLSLGELGLGLDARVATLSVLAPAQTERKQQIIENPSDEDLAQMLRMIQQ